MPFCVFCRSKFHEYKEYHTSADDLSFISQEGMEHSLQILLKIVQLLEYNRYYKTTILCEPQLGRRGLYPTIGQKGTYDDVRVTQNFLAYADGTHDLMELSNLLHVPVMELAQAADRLYKKRLIKIV